MAHQVFANRLATRLCHVKFLEGILLAIALLFAPLSFAQQGPSNLNINGTLFNSDGTSITAASVNFKLEVYDSNASCLLYSETHLGQDLSAAKGGFALELGHGSSISNLVDTGSPTTMTAKVFENSGSIAGGWAGCPSGATLGAGSTRVIRVYYDLGGGYTAMNPDVPIAAAAYSIVAETLQGKRPSDFIQVQNDVTNKLTQANVENIFSSANYPKLTDLLSGASASYISSNPTSAVSFNNQLLTDVASPVATTDATNKGYVDSYIGGKAADFSGVGPATGDGYTLIWDKASQTWTTGIPTSTDNTKLPLAGGTMSGAIDMDGNDILNTGFIVMSPLKTLTLGTFNNAQEATLVASLTAANAGTSWYNSQSKLFKIWDGAAAVSQSINGVVAGGDLTGTYPNPTIANDKIVSAMIDSAGAGINRLVISDQTDGGSLEFATCNTNEVLRWEGANGWVCRDPSSIVTYPVTSVNGKTGVVVLDANDLNLGTAALENIGAAAGEIPVLDAGGKIPATMIPAPTIAWDEIVNGTGKYMTYKPNDTACGNGEFLKFDGAKWICADISGLGTGDFMKDGSVAMTGNLEAGTHDLTNVGAVTGSSLTLSSTGANNGITLTPNGTGVVTTSRPLRVTPTTLPAVPDAGTIAFDSGASNALKFYDGSAWQTVGTGTGSGDFMKDGSVAMTGNLKLGANYISNDGGASEGLAFDTVGNANFTGSVGIGTASPAYPLDVAGNARAEGYFVNSNDAGIYWGSNDKITGHAGTHLIALTTNGVERLRVNSSGSVGIGTTAPTRLLDVAGSIHITPAALPSSPTPGELAFDSGAANALKFYDGSAWQTVGTGTGSGDFMKNGSVAMTGDFDAGTHDVKNVGAVTGSALSLTSTGTNNGITLTPNGTGVVTTTSPLRVTPSTLPASPAAGTLAVDSGAGNALKYYDGSAWQSPSGADNLGDHKATRALDMAGFNIVNGGTDGIFIATDGTVDVGASNGSNVGYHTLFRAYRNAVNNRGIGIGYYADGTDDTAGFIRTTGTSSDLILAPTNGSGDPAERVRLTSTGNLGIGTTSPARLLDVAGPIHLSPAALPGSPTAGELAFDSGAGNALKFYDGSAWQTVGTGTGSGDFKKDGSVAMTGNFNAGGHSLIGNTTASANLLLESTSDSTKGKVILQPNGGNVGIGTSTPLAPLTVYNPSADEALILDPGPGGEDTTTSMVFRNQDAGYYAGIMGMIDDDLNGRLYFTATDGTTVPAPASELKMAMSVDAFSVRTLVPLDVVDTFKISPNTLPASPNAGVLAFDSNDGNALKFYNGSAWKTVGTGTGSGDFMKDGSVAMTGNFNAGGNKILGNTTSGANLILESTSDSTKGYVLLQPTSGRVGIGTATPGYALHVIGTTYVNSNIIAAGYKETGTGNTILDRASGSVRLHAASTGDTVSIVSAAATALMTVTDAGNVGIGTTGPNRLLDVAGPIHIKPATLPTSPTAGELAFDSGASNALKFYDGSAWQTVGTGTGSGDFKKDGSVAMTGAFKATAGDTANPGIAFSSSADTGFYLYNTGIMGVTAGGSLVTTFGANYMSSPTSLGPYVSFAAGSLSNPSYSFVGNTNSGLYAPNSTSIGLVTGATERLRIDGSGNVGIGTTSPSTALDVNGKAKYRSGINASVRVITASGAVTVATTDYIVCINKTTGAATTVNLPSSPGTGDIYIIKDCKGDAATNNITITPASGNIDGGANYVINVSRQSAGIFYDGTQWQVF